MAFFLKLLLICLLIGYVLFVWEPELALPPDRAEKPKDGGDASPADAGPEWATTLSEASAAELVKQDPVRPLSLHNLVDLSPGAARILAAHSAPLCFPRLAAITEEAAAALGSHAGVLVLDGLKALPPDVARQLARHRHISHLGEFYNRLSLNGLEDMTAESAGALAPFLGNLSLCGLKTLTPDVANNLAKHTTDAIWNVADCYSLLLDGVTTLSDDAAIAIADYGGSLSFDGIEELSPTALMALAGHRGQALSMSRLRSMPEHVAIAFGAHTRTLYAPRLSGISSAARAALLRNPHVILPDESAKAS